MKIWIYSILLASFGCAPGESFKTERTPDLDQPEGGEVSPNSADAESASGKDKDSTKNPKKKFGNGELSRLQIASSMPRCGEKYSAEYNGKSKQKDLGGRSFDIDLETKSLVKGNKESATVTVTNKFKINSVGDQKQMTEERIGQRINRFAGARNYDFLSDDALADLKESNDTWKNIECAVFAAKELVFVESGTKKKFEFDPALPSLVTPNAAKEVYMNDIGTEGVTFSNIKATYVGTFRKKKDANGNFTDEEEYIVNTNPTSIRLDVTIKLVDVDGDNLTVDYEASQIGAAKSAQSDYALASYGVFPDLDLKVDTSLRRNRELMLSLPYEDDGKYFYGGKVTLKKKVEE